MWKNEVLSDTGIEIHHLMTSIQPLNHLPKQDYYKPKLNVS